MPASTPGPRLGNFGSVRIYFNVSTGGRHAPYRQNHPVRQFAGRPFAEGFSFDVEEVEISREGDAVILRPRPDATRRWASLYAAVERGFSADFMADGRDLPEEQDRPELDQVLHCPSGCSTPRP